MKTHHFPRSTLPFQLGTQSFGWLLVGLISVLTLVAVLRQSPGVISDPAWGLVAAEQYLQGKSSSPLHLTTVDPENIVLNKEGRNSWWAPSYQVAPMIFRAMGFTWGTSLRILFILVWISAAVAWGKYFSLTLESAIQVPWCLAPFLLYRYSHSDLHSYTGGEFLLWGIAPWVILFQLYVRASDKAPSRLSGSRNRFRFPLLCILAGMAAAGLFLVKYNAVFLSIGICLWWILSAVFDATSWKKSGWVVASCGMTFGFIWLAGFPGGHTTFDPAMDFRFGWMTTFWSTGSWIFAFSDLDMLIHSAFMRNDSLLFELDYTPLWYSILGVLLIPFFILVIRRIPWRNQEVDASGHAKRLAVVCLGFSILCYMLIAAESRSYLKVSRYMRTESLLIYPFIFSYLCRNLVSPSRIRCAMANLGIFILILVPAVYGGLTLLDKGYIRQSQTLHLVSKEGLRLDLLGEHADAKAFYPEIETLLNHRKPVVFISSPEFAIPLVHHRLIVSHFDFTPNEEILKWKYQGKPTDGAVLILQQQYADSRKVHSLRSSFINIKSWTFIPLKSAPGWCLWWGE